MQECRKRKDAMLLILAITVFAYLLGSIPFGLLVGRLRGIDIREHGSRNIGATNAVRVLGKPWGIPVFICDAAKGALAVFGAVWLAAFLEKSISSPSLGVSLTMLQIIAAIACILGHNFPVWLKFKGGKGIATSAGVLLALMPLVSFIAFVVWLLLFYTTRFVSVASIAAAAAIPLAEGFLIWRNPAGQMPLFYFSLIIAALAIWRHRANIERLLAGTENRFEKKPKTSP